MDRITLADGTATAYLRGMATTASAPGFDTLAYARRLKAAGVDEAQAEAHAEAVRDAITEGVATKADVADLKADLANLETRMVRFVFVVAAGQAALIVGLLKLLP